MSEKDKVEIIYSRQNSDFVKGKVYANPRFFSTPRADAGKVFIIGDWPQVEAAYKARGVPVVILPDGLEPALQVSELAARRPPQPPPPKPHPEVDIPETWQDLPWVGGEESLRKLAGQLTEQPVINKAQAFAVITAELARRGQPAREAGPDAP